MRTPSGDYWLGGYKELELFSPAQNVFTAPDFRLSSAILDLYLDSHNILWIATDKGLVRYNPVANTGQTFSRQHGLSSDHIVSIEQDDAGYLWLGTREGLNRFDPRSREVIVFDEHDGVAGAQFNRFSHLKSRSGRLYFGGTKGLTYFDPEDLPINHNAPQIHITGIEIGQRLQDPRQSPWMNTTINYVDTLTLSYEQRDVTLHFSATNLISPSQNLYRYRLYGQDDEWTETDSRHRRVRYNNLEPGEYRFQILAANNEGVWSGQFRVVYQPIINISSGELNSYEVLLRWHHPERGLVAPDIFIPMAESLGLIFDIGLWVLKQACEQLQEWKETLNPPRLPGIAVNLSPIQLERMDLLEKFEDIFEATGADRRHIKFEITESALMKHTDTVDRVLESLRSRGIELAIDDFGTGYSSLSYLDKLPVQILKVDRSFVNGLAQPGGKSGGAHEIVRATISLAHNLQMRVVAEGIETEEQLQALKNYGCDYGQGYLIARPLTPEDATQFLVDHVNSGDVRGKLD